MLLDLLGFAGNVLDTPGGMIRDSLAGRNPFENIFRPEERTTGRGLLEMLGLVGSNQEGLDAGDVGGFGVEMLLDPVNALGGFALRGTAKAAQAAKKSNALSEAMRAQGAMPEEIAKLTKVVDETGQPRRLYHGTNAAFDRYDPNKLDPGALYGKGIYATADPELAASYVGKGGHDTTLEVAFSRPDEELLRIARENPDARARLSGKFRRPDDPDQMVFGEMLTEDEFWSLPPARQAQELKDFASIDDGLLGMLGGRILETADKPLNVRMHFMDARNPLDMDASVPPEVLSRIDSPTTLEIMRRKRLPRGVDDLPPEVASMLKERRVPNSLIRSLSEGLSNPRFGPDSDYVSEARLGLEQFLGPEGAESVVQAMVPGSTLEALTRQPPTGQELWDSLKEGLSTDLWSQIKRARQNPSYKPLHDPNEVLQSLGYDAIRHTGGQIMGDRAHDVFIGFDPSQMYNPYIAPAMQDVPSMSPLLAALLGHNAIARPEWN